MTPANTLLSRARAYLQNRAGRTALTVAPLATLGLAAAGSAHGDTATFDPAAAFAYGPDSNGIYQYNASGGALEGSSLGTNSAGVTGATFDTGTGTGGLQFQDFEGGFAGTLGTIQIFSINGTGSGAFNPVNGSAQISYDFTLASTGGFGEAIAPLAGQRPAGVVQPTGASIDGGTLAVTVVTSTGTFSQSVSLMSLGLTSATYTGVVNIPVSGTLQTYSAVLTANYIISPTGDGTDAIILATVPAATSVDFTAVPEPSTWVILATGVAGAGWLQVMRVRQRAAKPVV